VGDVSVTVNGVPLNGVACVRWADPEISKRGLGSTPTAETGTQGSYAAAAAHAAHREALGAVTGFFEIKLDGRTPAEMWRWLGWTSRYWERRREWRLRRARKRLAKRLGMSYSELRTALRKRGPAARRIYEEAIKLWGKGNLVVVPRCSS
jgi:hypothetical protein